MVRAVDLDEPDLETDQFASVSVVGTIVPGCFGTSVHGPSPSDRRGRRVRCVIDPDVGPRKLRLERGRTKADRVPAGMAPGDVLDLLPAGSPG